MAPLTVAGHRWMFRESSILAVQPDSCLVIEDGSIDLQIPLARLTDVDAGIKEALAAYINYYCESLKGILISYSKLRLYSPNIDLSDIPCGEQEITVHGTFVLFRPEKGNLLKGVITRVNPHHIGCLVLKTFTASVRASSGSNINFEGVYNQGEEITFIVESLAKDGFCRVTGILTDDLILSHRNAVPSGIVYRNTDDVYALVTADTAARKKKTEVELAVPSINQALDDISDTVDVEQPLKKKKSKKDKIQQDVIVMDFIDPVDAVASGKKKKAKYIETPTPDQPMSSTTDIPDGFGDISDSESPPKRKKSKKSSLEPASTSIDPAADSGIGDTVEPESVMESKKARKSERKGLLHSPGDALEDVSNPTALQSSKKSRKSRAGPVNETPEEVVTNAVELESHGEKRKAKNVKSEELLNLEFPTVVSNLLALDPSRLSEKTSKKRKSKIMDSEDAGVNNPTTLDSSPSSERKSKKRKLEEPVESAGEVNEVAQETSLEPAPKKRKSKKSKTEMPES